MDILQEEKAESLFWAGTCLDWERKRPLLAAENPQWISHTTTVTLQKKTFDHDTSSKQLAKRQLSFCLVFILSLLLWAVDVTTVVLLCNFLSWWSQRNLFLPGSSSSRPESEKFVAFLNLLGYCVLSRVFLWFPLSLHRPCYITITIVVSGTVSLRQVGDCSNRLLQKTLSAANAAKVSCQMPTQTSRLACQTTCKTFFFLPFRKLSARFQPW